MATAEPVRRAYRCDVCGFEIWRPVASLEASELGLYSDARYPGRVIVVLRGHAEHLEELAPTVRRAFLEDVVLVGAAVRRATGAERVNYAILGNQERHLHAHVIPRHAASEPRPTRPVWEDPRPVRPLGDDREKAVVAGLRDALSAAARAQSA